MSGVTWVELIFCYTGAVCMLWASVCLQRMASACRCDNAIAVESVVTGEQVAEWCPDCQRRWYYLPYISGR